ncbi:MAG: chain-length determining protein [Muribaculaceae bacterium]|nr:chain-length determining protein [Muribaculaceae bacterium]
MANNIEEQELKDQENPQNEEKEIDLLELFYKLWSQKKLLLIWCMWGAIAGLIIAFSIPREYTATVKLAPEVKTTGKTMSGGLSALANLAGISTAGNAGTDAMYPQLYPDIVGSVPFLTSLFDVPVTDKDGNKYTVKEYLMDETSGPWWGVVLSLPGKVIGLFRSSDDDKNGEHTLNNFKLTPQEDKLVEALRSRVTASVDQKTSVITINSQMQDPVVSAILVDTVVSRLRDYITDYRTDKSRQDLDYALKLNDEAQQEYYNAQQRLADYTDRNQNLATQSARITRERLENEASLAFNLYNETSLQVQNAKSKVQETTPVYTEITPATVPLRPTSPRKGLILGGFIFLAFVACAAWILFGKPLVSEYKLKAQALKEEESNQKKEEKKEENFKDTEKK